jgi:DNA-binding MarR family transcriptional regulator
MTQDSYFRFLDKLSESNKKYNLSNDERLLLDVVATSIHAGKVMYVKDLITLNQIASQATLHKALSSLVDKRLLELKITKQDGRLKEVHLTKLASKRYEDLSKAIELAIKN